MPLDQGPSALTCCNITKTTCRKRHPVHRHEEVSSGKERVPGRQKPSLKVGQGCHLCIQTACHSLSGLSHPLLVHQNFSLPCQVPVTIEMRARRSSKDANTDWLLKVGKEGERSEKRGKEMGIKRKKQIFVGQSPQHMCLEGLSK